MLSPGVEVSNLSGTCVHAVVVVVGHRPMGNEVVAKWPGGGGLRK